MDSKELGRCGERLAAGYLSSHGYSVLEMNYRCRFGELDIVAVGRGSDDCGGYDLL